MPKPYVHKELGRNARTAGGTGYKTPSYTGVDKSRPRSNAAQAFNFPGDVSNGEGHAVGGPTAGKMPGQGQMGRYAGAGGASYPTSGTGQTHRGKTGGNLAGSKMRKHNSVYT